MSGYNLRSRNVSGVKSNCFIDMSDSDDKNDSSYCASEDETVDMEIDVCEATTDEEEEDEVQDSDIEFIDDSNGPKDPMIPLRQLYLELQQLLEEEPFEEYEFNEKQRKIYEKLKKKLDEQEPTPARLMDSKMPTKAKLNLMKLYYTYSALEPNSLEWFSIRDMIHDSLKEWEKMSKSERKQMKELNKGQDTHQKSLMTQIIQLNADPKVKQGLMSLYNTSDLQDSTHVNRLKMALKIPYNKVQPLCNQEVKLSNKEILTKVKTTLDEKLFGMEKVKKQLLIALNIRLNNPSACTCILLHGNAGLGKTAIAHALAEGLGLHFYKICCGNMDNAKILTGGESIWKGATSSALVQGMSEAGYKNPVVLLDELDKNTGKYNKEVENALLQILDPTQNNNFRDLNIPEVPIDISHMLFIGTCNDITKLSKPLLSRVRVINLSPYTKEELLNITKRHVIPSIEKKCCGKVEVSDEVVLRCIQAHKKQIDDLGIRYVNDLFEKVIGEAMLENTLNDKNNSVVLTDDMFSTPVQSDLSYFL